jgi:cytochrome b561
MSQPSETPAYDRIIRRLHWVNAILALATILLAFCLLDAPRHGETRGLLLTLHGSCGIVILVLMMFWGGWRLRHGAPPLPATMRWIETALARATQAALFVLFIAMPVTGYLSLAAAGEPLSFFGLVTIPPLMAMSGRVSQVTIALHFLGEFLIYGLVALHIGAALRHGFIRRDGILERMLPRRS